MMLGGDMRNNTLRSRLSCISILIGGMLLWWMWEAMMISYFAIPSKVLPFNTLEEFLTKSNKKVKFFIDFQSISNNIMSRFNKDYINFPFKKNLSFQLIVMKGSFTESVFRHSKDPIKQQIWKERIEPYIDEPIYSKVSIETVLLIL